MDFLWNNPLWNSTIGKLIMTAIISMVPIIELRGAVPFAYAQGMSIWVAVTLSIIGNLVPVPFIIIFIKKIFALIRKIKWLDKVVTKLENRAMKKADVVHKYAFWGLFVLVAIPLPGTGAWTGALVAAMLDMPLKKAFPSIVLGVVTAGIIVAFITCGADALFFAK